MTEILNTGTGRNYATLHKVPEAVLTRSFDSGGSTALTEKDLRLYLEEARDIGAPMWATSGLLPFWSFAVAQGLGPEDNTTAIRLMPGRRVHLQRSRHAAGMHGIHTDVPVDELERRRLGERA